MAAKLLGLSSLRAALEAGAVVMRTNPSPDKPGDVVRYSIVGGPGVRAPAFKAIEAELEAAPDGLFEDCAQTYRLKKPALGCNHGAGSSHGA
jgi:hypothetical protein